MTEIIQISVLTDRKPGVPHSDKFLREVGTFSFHLLWIFNTLLVTI
jgi:hypothetical protein